MSSRKEKNIEGSTNKTQKPERNPEQTNSAGNKVEKTTSQTTEGTWNIKPSSWYAIHTHGHLEIPLSKILTTKRPHDFFYIQKHKAHDLATLIQACASAILPLHRMALNQFTTHSKEVGNVLNLESGGDHQDIGVIKAYYTIFDQFFFFGSTQKRYRIPIQLKENIRNEFHGGVSCTTIGKFAPGKPVQWISTNISIQRSRNEDRKTRLSFYLETLLHQMIHAFFAIHSCRLSKCHVKIENEGHRSHSDAWQTVAYVVEKGVKEHFGLELNLGREFAYAWELARDSEHNVSGNVVAWGLMRMSWPGRLLVVGLAMLISWHRRGVVLCIFHCALLGNHPLHSYVISLYELK